MYKIFIAILLFTFALFLNNCGLSEDTVAKVGNQEIKAEEFKSELKKQFPDKENFADVDSSLKMRLLKQMIDKKRKLAAAYDMGIDKDETLKKAVESQKERACVSKYYEAMVVDSVIDLSKVNEYLDKMKDEVRASHILIRYQGTAGGPSNRSKEDAEKLANSLVKRIRNGESINTLAEKYSDDPSAKQNKGDLGYFTWGKMVDEFQQAAFNLKPGEISDPVLTNYGYHIIQVEDRRPNPNYNPDNLQAATYQIKSRLFSEVRQKGMDRWNALGQKIRDEYNFSIKDENLANLAAITSQKKDIKNLSEKDFTEDEKAIVLAEYDGGKFTFNDLLNQFQRRFRALSPKLTNPEKLKPDIENAVNIEIVKLITQREHYDQDPDIKRSIDQTFEQQMISLLDKKATEVNSDVSDDELQTYYEKNLNEFKNEAEIEIWEIFTKDKNTAQKVAKMARSGQDFEKLAEKYTEDASMKKKKGYVGFKMKNRRGPVSLKAFEVGPDKITGPIEYRKGWAVIKTGQLKPESTKPFEEVKARVTQRYKRDKMKEKRDAWNKEILEKYQAQINYKLLDTI